MRVISKPVNMVCVCYVGDKPPIPYKFKMRYNDNTEEEIKVELVMGIDTLTILPAPVYLYRCRTCIDDRIVEYELRYTAKTSSWEICGI